MHNRRRPAKGIAEQNHSPEESHRVLQLLQLIISGAAIGCIYALIALGFVLIYKATETVNFAQGDIMMIGGFVGLTAMTLGGLPFWAAFLPPSWS
jgi:branched-subunit amino acid ABC-type transport system permease component